MKSATNKEELKIAVNQWAERLRVRPKQIRVQQMKRKWASCSTAGMISLSADLTNESEEFRDYVIVHELLHLRVPNHGKLFSSLMSVYVPHWRKIESSKANKYCLNRSHITNLKGLQNNRK